MNQRTGTQAHQLKSLVRRVLCGTKSREEAALLGHAVLGSAIDQILTNRGANWSDFQELLAPFGGPPAQHIPWTSEQLRDPYFLGWVFLLTARAQEEKATWAISRKGETSMRSEQVVSATRIFTDGHLATDVIDAGWKTRRVPSPSVCDPACGAGHLLVTALSRLLDGGDSPTVAVGRIYGFDIDPRAVEVARIALLAELLRSGVPFDPVEITRTLIDHIQVLPGPRGSLHRERNLPGAPYDLIVMNPPYLGRRKMPAELREYLQVAYPAAAGDLCVAFLVRALELLRADGDLSWIGLDKWRTLKQYERFRSGDGRGWGGFLQTATVQSIREVGSRAFRDFSTLHDGVSVSIVHVRPGAPDRRHAVTLTEPASEETDIAGRTRTVLQSVLCAGGKDWERELCSVAEIGAVVQPLADMAHVVVGAQTNDDRRFVKYHWELPFGTPGWTPHLKGGGYSRWAGQEFWLLDTSGSDDSFIHRRSSGWHAIQELLDTPGYSSSWLANGALGVRVRPAGFSIGRAASSGIFFGDVRLLAVLNSRVASFFVRRIGGKVQLTEGTVKRLPCPADLSAISAELVQTAVDLSLRLMRSRPEEYAFRPEFLLSPLEHLNVAEQLLRCEAELEHQVEAAYGLGRGGLKLLDQEFGIRRLDGSAGTIGSRPLPTSSIFEAIIRGEAEPLDHVTNRLRAELMRGEWNAIAEHCAENAILGALLDVAGHFTPSSRAVPKNAWAGLPELMGAASTRAAAVMGCQTRESELLLRSFADEHMRLLARRFRGVMPWSLRGLAPAVVGRLPTVGLGDFRPASE